jgi:hypothetical protein
MKGFSKKIMYIVFSLLYLLYSIITYIITHFLVYNSMIIHNKYIIIITPLVIISYLFLLLIGNVITTYNIKQIFNSVYLQIIAHRENKIKTLMLLTIAIIVLLCLSFLLFFICAISKNLLLLNIAIFSGSMFIETFCLWAATRYLFDL